MRLVLGIETSCDETAVALVEGGRRILAAKVVSQIDIHRKFGGVVPEVAARQHLETLNYLIEDVLKEADLEITAVDAIACTQGPGLIGTLLTGLSAAKVLAWAADKPLILVDHLMAHVCANFINTELQPPFIALLVSGGHTQIIHFSSYQQYDLLGETLDDAAGEAYDKVARLLGLGYPGGPVIDRLAASGNPLAFPFPEGNVAGYGFSFSGLKTAVLRCVEKLAGPLPIEDLCASFQEAVSRVLARKTVAAALETKVPCIVLAGGVAANSALRRKLAEQSPIPVYYPEMALCTDNAAMVAGAAFFCGKEADLAASVYSRQKKRR